MSQSIFDERRAIESYDFESHDRWQKEPAEGDEIKIVDGRLEHVEKDESVDAGMCLVTARSQAQTAANADGKPRWIHWYATYWISKSKPTCLIDWQMGACEMIEPIQD
jgi:hypothetical protein